MKDKNLKKFVAIAMFSSIAYILMLLNFPMPGFPPFLNIDFSDIPALLAAVIFGPLAGIVVELIKNILDYAMTGSETGIPIGHMANFIAGVAFVLPSYYIYNKFTNKKGLVVGLSVATIFMAVLMAMLNYFVILPAYTVFAHWDVMSSAETRSLVTTAILPFNIIKGILMTCITLLLFGKLQSWLAKISPMYQLHK
ncbi:ECF transporter S component [Bacillus sp. 1P06AnD]|uniref:ECF transporter S component n=1 Tax=Bacillus sp. 1P06AnD TaxID=3132208 RepID=UPI0039A3EA2E